MNRRTIAYSQTELMFICARRDLPRRDLHAAFVAEFGRRDVGVQHIKALCTRHGWTTERRAFTPEEEVMLREQYPNMPTADLAVALQRSVTSVYARAKELRVIKSAAFMAGPTSGRMRKGSTIGAASRFQRGHTSPNKGVKRPEGWSPGRMRETQFRKAQSPRNCRPLGSVRVIKGYQFTKVRDEPMVSWTRNWRQTHVLNWEAVHGPVPEGHALKSVDGNSLNTDVANWQLVPRSILPRLAGGRHGRLGYDRAPDELKPIILTSARLAHAVKRRARQVAA